MKLSEIKDQLTNIEELVFVLPNGSKVPSHFHVTEVGTTTKKFIDCGGKYREESNVNFQLFVAQDIDHKLQASKLLKIIELTEKNLELPDANVVVEYQGNTIETYDLNFAEGQFQLVSKFTDCLAMDDCGIPPKMKFDLSGLSANNADVCTPGGGCC